MSSEDLADLLDGALNDDWLAGVDLDNTFTEEDPFCGAGAADDNQLLLSFLEGGDRSQIDTAESNVLLEEALDQAVDDKQVVLAAAAAAGLNRGGLKHAFSTGDLQALNPPSPDKDTRSSKSGMLESVPEGNALDDVSEFPVHESLASTAEDSEFGDIVHGGHPANVLGCLSTEELEKELSRRKSQNSPTGSLVKGVAACVSVNGVQAPSPVQAVARPASPGSGETATTSVNQMQQATPQQVPVQVSMGGPFMTGYNPAGYMESGAGPTMGLGALPPGMVPFGGLPQPLVPQLLTPLGTVPAALIPQQPDFVKGKVVPAAFNPQMMQMMHPDPSKISVQNVPHTHPMASVAAMHAHRFVPGQDSSAFARPGIPYPIPPQVSASIAQNVTSVANSKSNALRKCHSTPSLSSLVGNGTALPVRVDIPLSDKPRIGRLTPEERRQKILRYRQKRHERRFDKRVTYQCRKTLADSRPRVRGRFARNDDENAVMPREKKMDGRTKMEVKVEDPMDVQVEVESGSFDGMFRSSLELADEILTASTKFSSAGASGDIDSMMSISSSIM